MGLVGVKLVLRWAKKAKFVPARTAKAAKAAHGLFQFRHLYTALNNSKYMRQWGIRLVANPRALPAMTGTGRNASMIGKVFHYKAGKRVDTGIEWTFDTYRNFFEVSGTECRIASMEGQQVIAKIATAVEEAQKSGFIPEAIEWVTEGVRKYMY